MTVPKSVLIAFAFLLMAGTGGAMYVGVQLGLANADSAPPAAQPTSAAAAADAPSRPEPVHTHEEPCPEVLAAETEEPEESRASRRSGSTTSGESGNFATNSGVVSGSQFSDGGFGDIGQQWWNVNAGGDIITVNVADGGTATVDSGSEPATNAVPDAVAAANDTPAVEVSSGAGSDAPPPPQPSPEEVAPAPSAEASPATHAPERDSDQVDQAESAAPQPVE